MVAAEREFLFLSCDVRDVSARKPLVKTYKARRHVQLNRRDGHKSLALPALPLQIRYSTAQQCHCDQVECTCRQTTARQPSRKGCRNLDGQSKSMDSPDISPFPVSETLKRASHLAQWMSALCLQDHPMDYIPSRLGHDKIPILDRATDALLQLLTSPKTPQGAVDPSMAAARDYSQALTMFRTSFSSNVISLDETISAICLLGMFDVLVRDQYRATIDSFTHWRGVSAVLLHDPLASIRSEYVQAIMSPTAGGCLTFIIPCFQGRPSPFDTPCWLDMPLGNEASVPAELARLNRVAHRLYIRLPRLMCLVRQWREGTYWGSRKVMRRLADELGNEEDREAEQWLLARAKSIPTRDPDTAKIIPSSFSMAKYREAATALCYWQTRIMALKLLDTLDPHTAKSRVAELETTATNILMTCEYLEGCGYCATAPVAIALATVWLVCRTQTNCHGRPLNDLANAVLKTTMRCWSGAALGGTLEELDKVANVLIGGKLEGYLCDSVVVWQHQRGS